MARTTKRRGRWTYEKNTGWRLDDTNLVLDFDPLDAQGPLRGAWALFVDGTQGPTVDHYLDGAMQYVETHQGELAGASATTLMKLTCY